MKKTGFTFDPVKHIKNLIVFMTLTLNILIFFIKINFTPFLILPCGKIYSFPSGGRRGRGFKVKINNNRNYHSKPIFIKN